MSDRQPAGKRLTIAFHAVMSALWISLVVVKVVTHFSNLVFVGIGAGLGIAGHGLSAYYGIAAAREIRELHARREAILADAREVSAKQQERLGGQSMELAGLRRRVAELEATQRPTRRDPQTGRYVSRKT